MKKTTLLKSIFVLILVLSLSSLALATSPEIIVSTLTYSPIPLNGGDTFDIWIQVNNGGGDEANDFKFQLLSSEPFYLDSGETSQKEISRLDAHGVSKFHYNLRVRADAEAGEYFLYYRYKHDGIGNWEIGQLPLQIETRDSNVIIGNVTIPKEGLFPGATTPVSIHVDNIADSFIKNLQVKLNVFSANPITGDPIELPFTPIGSSDEQILYTLAPGANHVFTFNVLVDPDAEVKPYKVPVTITYEDDQGEEHTKNLIIGLLVDLEPSLLVVPNDMTLNGDRLTFDVKFVNNGLIGLKFFESHLKESPMISSVYSDSSQYIGDLDSDDYETLEFSVKLTKDALTDMKIDVPLIYSFYSSNNKEYNLSETLSLDLSKATIQKASRSKGIIIVLLVIIVGIIFLMRRRKKKRELELNAKVNRRK